MKIARPASGICRILMCFALLAGAAIDPASQAPAANGPLATSNRANQVAQAVHAEVELNGPWRFQIGDDPDGKLGWADPNFDDSSWTPVSLRNPLVEQGIPEYSGYAWYRLRLSPEQVAQAGQGQLQLLAKSFHFGQLALFVDGQPAGRSQGMTATPRLFESPPFAVPLPATASTRGVVLAIRAWANLPIRNGLLASVQIGDARVIADRLELERDRAWGYRALSEILAGFLFFCVAGLAATLYLAQRHHIEYLWLALLCLAVTLRGCLEVALDLAAIPWNLFNLVGNWTGWLFMAATLEFVFRFTASGQRGMTKAVRAAQLLALALPVVLAAHLDAVSSYVSLAVELGFLAMAILMLFRAWQAGRREAGVMLIPFFLAGFGDLGDSVLQFGVSEGWLPESFSPSLHRIGPVQFSNSLLCYLLFLASLLAVILYRFIRVSQEEQRSMAEIEAARSVQAMLIPTELPSTRTFALDSAYFPINGVGGDFFQALPLADDSILIVVGDVSGKGLQAAMNASSLVGALRNELSHDPATVLGHLNRVMLGASQGPGAGGPASFATCLCARIYPDGRMTVANAGHLSPYRDGREIPLTPDLPLGIVPNIQYEQATVQLTPGDRLVFLSDGVVEAANAKGELFGFERTQQMSQEPARFIAQTAQKFGQTDDITVVSLYFLPAPAGAPLLQSHP